jgi:hypothetical protein
MSAKKSFKLKGNELKLSELVQNWKENDSVTNVNDVSGNENGNVSENENAKGNAFVNV